MITDDPGRHVAHESCRTCGQDDPACLTWADYDTSVGLARVIQCQDCLDDGDAPNFTFVEAALLAMSHPDYVPDEGPAVLKAYR